MTFIHGTKEELKAQAGRPYHDVSGVLFGRTYDVPRKPKGDGDLRGREGQPRGPIEWTSTVDGTIIGTGGHLHPGGLRVVVENYGSEGEPLPRRRARVRRHDAARAPTRCSASAPFSEDFQMEVTHPALARADPQGRPDPDQRRPTRTRTTPGTTVMTHEGFYIDPSRSRGRAARRGSSASRASHQPG